MVFASYFIFLPFINSLICGFLGWFIGFRGAKLISILLLFQTCCLSFCFFCQVGFLKNPYYIVFGYWIKSGLLDIKWAFLFDSLTVTMAVIVTTVSFLVHLYSSSYMEADPHLTRFMTYLSLFTFFMLLLITADNFLILFLGWEGVGLCSYLLISFWYTRVQANKAAIKAMIINRVGDFSLLLAIIFIFYTFKTLDYSIVFILTPFFLNKSIILFGYSINFINLITCLLFIGAVGKSAQIGLHTWLPDAMEGPTPVSALIHAATMVTAGIFLIIRCSPIFEYSIVILNLITVVGALTAFFAASIGLVQNDIKKIIAYSTCSQLGYMAFVCGTSNYTTALFHLSNHAFFKALLFLSAGSVIHGLGNEQDIRKMGGLAYIMPFTYSMMLIGSFSLAGFPFLSGFYSKDFILELTYTKYTVHSLFAYWLGFITAFFTAIYSFRLIYLVFLSRTNAYKQSIIQLHEAPILMALPLMLLSIGSIISGYTTQDIFIGLGSDFFEDSIFIIPCHSILVDAENTPFVIKLMPTFFSFLGIWFALFKYQDVEYSLVINRYYYYHFNYLHKFLTQKWYFDHLQNELLAKPALKKAATTFLKELDKGFLEIVGPSGLSNLIYYISIKFKSFQSGYIYRYAFLLVFLMQVYCLFFFFFNI